MIYWVYNQACKVKEFDHVYVATDDERIYNTCKEYNMAVIMTSEDCATGSDRVAEVSTKVEGDLFVNIQGDEPVIGTGNDPSGHLYLYRRRNSIFWQSEKRDHRSKRNPGTKYCESGNR